MQRKRISSYRYTVSFSGRFPMDMLRHDCAWPRDTSDAMSIGSSWSEEEQPVGPTVVNLCGLFRPTIGRWASFSAYVDELTIETVYDE